MNDLTVFKNDTFGSVRVVELDGEPWFVGKDVAEILGYQNVSKALADHVDVEDKLNNDSLLSLGQRGGWLINESGLYALILTSKLQKAKEFKRWVTSEVLPSIRKTGAYGKPMSQAELALWSAQQLVEQERRLTSLEDHSKAQDARLDELDARTTTRPETFYTIAGYWKKMGKPISTQESANLGKKASNVLWMMRSSIRSAPIPSVS